MSTLETSIDPALTRLKNLVGGDFVADQVTAGPEDPEDPDEAAEATADMIRGPKDRLDKLEALIKIGYGDPTTFAILTGQVSWQDLHGFRQSPDKGVMRFFRRLRFW